MAEVLVRHSLNTNKAIKFNFTIRQVTTTKSKGDPIWIFEVGTTHLNISGESIPPIIIHNIDLKNIDLILENAVSNLCTDIEWGVLETDQSAPVLICTYPENKALDVPIKSVIKINITDLLPSAGIDLSDLKVTFDNGDYLFDITNEIKVEGVPINYTLKWYPHNLEV